MNAFEKRIVQAARSLGSSANTLRGAVRYLTPGNPRAARSLARAGREQRKAAAPAARPAPTPNSALVARCKSDAIFRRATIRRMKLGLQHVAGPKQIPAWIAAAKLLVAVGGRPQQRPWAVVTLAPPEANELGWDHRGSIARYEFGHSFAMFYTSGKSEYRSGRWKTITLAERVTTLQSVAVSTRPGVITYHAQGRDKSYSWALPAGCSLADLGDGCGLPGAALSVPAADGGRQLFDLFGAQILMVRAYPMPADLRERFGAWEHAASAPAAAAEIALKRQILRVETPSKKDLRAARLLSRSQRILATYADARAHGFCVAGIQAWLGPDRAGVTELPLAVLSASDDTRARELARAVAGRVWAARI